uniref:Uncharacterized protein n=1 Tax=Eptatretus burgeri TaxID=7764 RepID=A0A8C4NC16_EPTBU
MEGSHHRENRFVSGTKSLRRLVASCKRKGTGRPSISVYPSLESEDEEPVFKSRAKKRRSVGDAPWNPGAKVVPSVPRPERPVREGTRVPSIETGLAAAAAKLSQQPDSPGGQEQQKPQKKKPAKRKTSLSTPPPAQLSVEKEEVLTGETLVEQHASPEPRSQEFFSGSLADHEYTSPGGALGAVRGATPMAPGVFLSSRKSTSGTPSGISPSIKSGKRPRKGLATAKQRLGKILKIQKNGRLLL